MALFDRRYDPADASTRGASPRAEGAGTGLLLVFIAALVAVLIVMAVVFHGETNAGPSVKAVSTQSSLSTSPMVATPTTEPRPTQAPIQ